MTEFSKIDELVIDFNELRIEDFGDRCERLIDAAELGELLNRSRGALSSRKALCDTLGIGESTLSGWLKDDRIPRMAKLVIGIVLSNELMSEETEHHVRGLKESAYGPRLLQDGDSFMIAEFEKTKGTHGAGAIGRILARGIPDKESAIKLISYHELRKTLILAAEALGPVADGRPRPYGQMPDIEDHVMNEILDHLHDQIPEKQAAELFGERLRYKRDAADVILSSQSEASDDK